MKTELELIKEVHAEFCIEYGKLNATLNWKVLPKGQAEWLSGKYSALADIKRKLNSLIERLEERRENNPSNPAGNI